MNAEGVSRAATDGTKLLQALVAPVAALGELAAAVTGPERGERWAVSRAFLRGTLREFTWRLRYTLERRDIAGLDLRDVPPEAQGDVPSLRLALATLGATPEATWAKVRATAHAWWEALDAFAANWYQLSEEAFGLRERWKKNAEAIAEAIAEATKATNATKSAMGIKSTKSAKAITKTSNATKASKSTNATKASKGTKTSKGTKATKGSKGTKAIATATKATKGTKASKGSKGTKATKSTKGTKASKGSKATATKATKSTIATKGSKGTKATKSTRVTKASKAIANARRGPQEEMALGLLERLVDDCLTVHDCFVKLLLPLKDIESVLGWRKEPSSPEVRHSWMAEAAERERLWEASARLASRHLLGTLRDIHELLVSPLSGRGGPGGPGGRAVAERCQRALEDIPGLLEGDGDVTAGTSSGR